VTTIDRFDYIQFQNNEALSFTATKENDIYCKYRVNVRQSTEEERTLEKLKLSGNKNCNIFVVVM
jgi:flagellar assembly factor FliW